MTQFVTKFIADNAITDTKIALTNNGNLRARNAANTAYVNLLKLTAADLLEFQTAPYVLSSLPIPTGDKQLATIEYIKNYVLGKTDAKDAAQYLADTNVSGTFTAGTSTTGATLVSSSALTVDGTTFGASDVTTPFKRIALTGQTTGFQNGVFDLTAAGASSFTLTRSSDFSTVNNASGTQVTSGAYFRIVSGTVYAGYEVLLTTPDPITIDTTVLTFARYPTTASLTGGDMITRTGNDFTIDLATNGGLESTNAGNAAGQLRVKTATGALEKDRTIQLDGSGNVTAKKSKLYTSTLSSTDITNQYVDLPDVAGDLSIIFTVVGGGIQTPTADYSVNYTGGASSKTRITFAGGLATGGVSALAAGDIVYVYYKSF